MQVNNRYDAAARRRSQRHGREKGCWVYVPADVLRQAGHDPDGPAPYFRTWGSRRSSVLIRLYKEA